jgi:GGDEF domain-containing protein
MLRQLLCHLHSPWSLPERWLWLWLLACWLCSSAAVSAQAAPQIDWGRQIQLTEKSGQHREVTLALQDIWEATRVSAPQLQPTQFFAPDQVWQWPADRFGIAPNRENYMLSEGQRLVARATLFSEQAGTDLNFSAAMPRLDALHLSYRYDNGPWITLSSGDLLAMQDWALPGRQPAFDIPLRSGQLDLVVEIAHSGNVLVPYLLQNDRAFLNSVTGESWALGMAVGINVVLALLGVLLALNFRRVSFLAVSLMSVATAAVLFFGSGLGGMYLGASFPDINDRMKFLSHNLWCLSMPWVCAVALGLRQYAARWWLLALAIFASGLAGSLVWMDYSYRDSVGWGVPLLLVVIIVFTALLVAWAWLRGISREPAIVVAVVAYVVALLLPYAGFTGLLGQLPAFFMSAFMSVLSALLFMRGLYMSYRMGRQVMARANISEQRDVLTGLLNRSGFEAHMQRLRQRTQQEQTCAVFCYINVADVQTAQQMLGEEGFEMGMVQIAATLSSSVSGVDGLGRVSSHAFGITVLMPPDPAIATRFAQKILSRMMALSTHGTALAGSTRMTLAWLPLFGFKIDSLERRALRTLAEMDINKRIGWVGGQESHVEAAQMLRDARLAESTPSQHPEDNDNELLPKNLDQVSNLSERIRRIEREMLQGVDTKFLMAEADRMSRLLNEKHEKENQSRPSQHPDDVVSTQIQPARPDDYPPTEIISGWGTEAKTNSSKSG